MNSKRAVFIVNSDNLAEVLDKLKQQLQTNIMIQPNFFSQDDKFYRLKNSGAGGTGLGLSIVKGFVEAMNGKITLQNMLDGGAVFTIEIPSELSYIQG